MSDYDDNYDDYYDDYYDNYHDGYSENSINEYSSDEYSDNYQVNSSYNRPNSNYYNRHNNSNNYYQENRSYSRPNSNYYSRPYNSNNYGNRTYYINDNNKRYQSDSSESDSFSNDSDNDNYRVYKRNRYNSSSDNSSSSSSEENTSSDSVILDEDGYNYNSSDFYSDDDSYDGNSSDDYDEIFSMNNFEERKIIDQTEYANMYNLPDKNQRLIIVDTEVSGITDRDNVIEICAFEMINGKLTGNRFHRFFKPQNHMSDSAIDKHRIPKSVFFNTPFKDRRAMNEFLDFVGDSQIIAHNAEHDMKKINHDLINWNLDPIPQEQFNCSMRIFYRMYPEVKPVFSSLYECCQNMGIPVKKRNLHLATYDSYLAGKIMEKIYKNRRR